MSNWHMKSFEKNVDTSMGLEYKAKLCYDQYLSVFSICFTNAFLEIFLYSDGCEKGSFHLG